ncbi:hypothetical protein GS934_12155 [Rhodococcus hoagii]|nr:hypothetical protein [Prescottella equi]NKZ87816.1 hypothetical protein [Prescottella equi]
MRGGNRPSVRRQPDEVAEQIKTRRALTPASTASSSISSPTGTSRASSNDWPGAPWGRFVRG